MRFALVLLIGVAAAAQDLAVVRQGKYILWRDPGAVESLDFRYGEGGAAVAPKPPFSFIREELEGTAAKVMVRDANQRQWSVKFGSEARADAFCSRMAWALGYFVTPTHFIPEGVISGAGDLERAGKFIDRQGAFRGGRFQLRASEPKYLRTVDWAWDDNPFVGEPELNGLKILMMLVSNWDDKDSRDSSSRGSNTAIYQRGDTYIYFINDWGGAMGSWGKLLTRSKWNVGDFERQSSDFVKVESSGLRWGYTGQHTDLMTRDIRFSDVTWLIKSLGRVTDEQLRAGLDASGATEDETLRFAAALRTRIEQLRKVAE